MQWQIGCMKTWEDWSCGKALLAARHGAQHTGESCTTHKLHSVTVQRQLLLALDIYVCMLPVKTANSF